MRIQAEVSLYPLRTQELSKPVKLFWKTLVQNTVTIESGAMSTRISGDFREVFTALESAFTYVAEEYEVIMTVKMSNACPNCGEK